ncbi:MAG: tetratricopeptide repeat protein [bacterium]|nr:tetratricopeptide repeat protein [bacterium]
MGDGRPYLLRPYVEGRPFDVAAAGESTDQLCTWLTALLSTLSTLSSLHRAGLVHRDIKASNVIVGGEGVYLIDLELVAGVGEATAAGTPFHVAPEVLLGQPHRPQADLFSLGAMFAYALCGPPDDGFTARFPQQPFWRAAGLDPTGLPDELGPLIRSLVRRHPGDRPSSARAAKSWIAGEAALPPLRLPMLAGRSKFLDDAMTAVSDGEVVVLTVADDSEIEDVVAELGIRAAMSTREEAPPIAVEHEVDGHALVERLRSRLVECRPSIVVTSSALQAALPALGPERQELVEVIFPRVSAEAVEEHLNAISAGASPTTAAALARSLVERCDGRRVEIDRRLSGATDEGVLRPGAGSFEILRDACAEVSVAEPAFVERVARLPEASRDALVAAALLRRRADRASLARLAGLEPADAARALDELYAAGALEAGIGPGGAVLVTDQRLLDAAMKEVTPDRLVRMRRVCIELLREREAAADEIALHELAIATSAAELDLLTGVAERERELGHQGAARALVAGILERAAKIEDPGEAVIARARVLEARLEIGQGNAGAAADGLERAYGSELAGAPPNVWLVAAEAAEAAGRRTEARGLYERVLDNESAGPHRSRAVLGVGYALFLDGNPQGAIDRIDGFPTPNDADETAGALLNLRAGALTELGQFDAAQVVLDQALACASDPTLLGRTELNRGYVLRRSGVRNAAIHALERAKSAFERADHVKMTGLAANNLAVLHRDLGQLERAAELLRESLELRRRSGDAHGTAVTTSNLGLVALDAGHVGDAITWLNRASALLVAGGYTVELMIADAHRVIALGLAGRLREARELMANPSVARLKAAKPLLAARVTAVLALGRRRPQTAIANLRRVLEHASDEEDAAERFRTGRTLLALAPGDVTATQELTKAAGELESVQRRSEQAWLCRDRSATPELDQLEEWLTQFESAGRTDLAVTITPLLARSLHIAGRPRERRRVMARAREMTDALTDGVEAAEHANVLDRLTKLACGERADARVGRIGVDWFVDWNRRMAREQDLEDLLQATMDMALEVTSARAGFLVLLKDGEIDVEIARGADHEQMPKEEISFSRTVVRRTIDLREPILTADAARDERFAGVDSIRGLELSAILSVPLPEMDGVSGAVYLDNFPGRAVFDDFDIEAVQSLVDQVAIAIAERRQRAQVEALNERLQEQLGFREEELVHLRTIVRRGGGVPPPGGLVGESAAMVELFGRIARFARTDLPVLLTGPRGAETELVARARHERSARSSGPYLSQHIAALPADTVEDELFGHLRKSEAGLTRNRLGLVARANRGTLFLDAIDEIPLEVQERLFETLETGSYRPAGARGVRRTELRIIASRRTDVGQRIASGQFLPELLYLLNTVEIRVPSLADRVEDIPALARQCLDELNARQKTAKTLDPAVIEALTRRPWPGELRELTNEVVRLYYLSDDAIDDPEIVRSPRPLGAPVEAMPASFRIEDVERAAVARALEATGGNKDRAAKLLGISRAGLYKKLSRLGLR